MNFRKKETGFTIIEVVLVLAIAGLIFLMVFIALPALQRSQRDTQRKNDLSRLTNALQSYTQNNRGNLPTSDTWGSCDDANPPVCTGFLKSYVATNGDNFTDPSGTPYILKESATPSTLSWDDKNPTIYITRSAVCKDESVKTDQGARKIAFQMKLEGSGTLCQSN